MPSSFRQEVRLGAKRRIFDVQQCQEIDCTELAINGGWAANLCAEAEVDSKKPWRGGQGRGVGSMGIARAGNGCVCNAKVTRCALLN
jgi:hypothetical protein